MADKPELSYRGKREGLKRGVTWPEEKEHREDYRIPSRNEEATVKKREGKVGVRRVRGGGGVYQRREKKNRNRHALWRLEEVRVERRPRVLGAYL